MSCAKLAVLLEPQYQPAKKTQCILQGTAPIKIQLQYQNQFYFLSEINCGYHFLAQEDIKFFYDCLIAVYFVWDVSERKKGAGESSILASSKSLFLFDLSRWQYLPFLNPNLRWHNSLIFSFPW